MHPVDTTWQMEYAEIRRVRVRYGVGTKIVELHGGRIRALGDHPLGARLEAGLLQHRPEAHARPFGAGDRPRRPLVARGAGVEIGAPIAAAFDHQPSGDGLEA